MAYLATNFALAKIVLIRRDCMGAKGHGDHYSGDQYYRGGLSYYGGANGGRVKLLILFCEHDWLLKLKYLFCCDLVEAASVVADKAREESCGVMSFNCAS